MSNDGDPGGVTDGFVATEVGVGDVGTEERTDINPETGEQCVSTLYLQCRLCKNGRCCRCRQDARGR